MKYAFIFLLGIAACNSQPEVVDCTPPPFPSNGGSGLPPGVSAKRAAPKPAAPVITDSIGFFAPDTAMGYIEARNVKTGGTVWKKQLYKISYDSTLEQDVQDAFIDSMIIKCNYLFVHNEKNEVFRLDLGSQQVEKIQ